ncbi:MAG: Bax inhibitor-1/YccA family protein [Methanosarcinales archaeon]|nr:Bax inhibitor-1/YccA family protein [Methanosarcinales archaeon]
MRTANPALNKNTFVNYAKSYSTNVMTIQGTVNKTLIILLFLMLGALWVWDMFYTNNPLFYPMMILGLIGGLVAAIVTIFKKEWSPFTAPVYGLLEGLVLGGISSVFEAMYPGIVIQAVALTFGTLFALLFAYKSRLIKATENFKLGVAAATGAIFMIYLATIVLGMFGVGIPFIHESGLIGIGFSLFVVTIAALNLVLDFDFIERGAQSGAPKFMEWYAAFGLMVTLIWLYIEILRLLAKLRSRD